MPNGSESGPSCKEDKLSGKFWNRPMPFLNDDLLLSIIAKLYEMSMLSRRLSNYPAPTWRAAKRHARGIAAGMRTPPPRPKSEEEEEEKEEVRKLQASKPEAFKPEVKKPSAKRRGQEIYELGGRFTDFSVAARFFIQPSLTFFYSLTLSSGSHRNKACATLQIWLF